MIQNSITQQAECLACPWNKQCVQPPQMTEEEVKARIGLDKNPDSESKEDAEKSLFGGLLNAMMFGGKDKEAPVCPIFANALRAGPELTQKIKDIMQGKV